jgi:hypothetical protein
LAAAVGHVRERRCFDLPELPLRGEVVEGVEVRLERPLGRPEAPGVGVAAVEGVEARDYFEPVDRGGFFVLPVWAFPSAAPVILMSHAK